MKKGWHKKILPKSAAEWVMAGGIFVYLLTMLLGDLVLPPLDLLNPTWSYSIMKTIGDTAFFLSIVVMIADCVRRVGRNGRSWKNISMLIISIAIPLIAISAFIYGHRVYTRATELFVPDVARLELMAKKLQRPDLPPDFRSALSRIYAKRLYSDYGQIVRYTTPDGDQVLYQPTDEDKEFRNDILKGRKIVELGRHSMLRAVIAWSAVIVVGLLSGLFVLRRQAKNATI